MDTKDPLSCMYLANYYFNGIKCEKNSQKGIELFNLGMTYIENCSEDQLINFMSKFEKYFDVLNNVYYETTKFTPNTLPYFSDKKIFLENYLDFFKKLRSTSLEKNKYIDLIRKFMQSINEINKTIDEIVIESSKEEKRNLMESRIKELEDALIDAENKLKNISLSERKSVNTDGKLIGKKRKINE